MNPSRAAVRRVLSWKRFALVAGVLLACAVAAGAVHRAQERRNADALKSQAAAAAADPARRNTALALYERYIRFRPKDEDAYREYVKLVLGPAKDDPSQFDNAGVVTETFLRKFPNNPEERKQLVELYMRLAKTKAAREHLETLFKSDEKYRTDPDLREKAATCEVADGKPAAAIDHLKKAIDTGRAPISTYRRLIWLYWENHQAIRDAEGAANDLARFLIEDERFRTNPEARVVAADYRMLRKDLASADEQIKKALALPGGSENPEVLLAAARFEVESMTPADAKARLAAARDYLERARRSAPANIRVALRLAEIVLLQGQRDEARKVLVAASDTLDKPNDLYLRLVDQLIDLGERDRSAKLTDALSKDPNMKKLVAYYRGRLGVLAGDWVGARNQLDDAAAAFAGRADLKEYRKKLHADLGRCYQALQNPDRQLHHHQLALDDDQGYVPAVIGKADALAKLGEVEKSLPYYRTLVSEKGYGLTQFRPTLARLELLAVLKTPEDDRKWGSFNEALGPPETRTADLELLRAEALAIQGNAAEAAKVVEAVVAKAPDYPNGWLALVRLKYHGRSEPALAELDAVQKKAGDSPERRVTRGMLLASRSSRRPTADEFRKLAADVEQFSKPAHYRLWVGLGEAASWASNVQPDAAAAKELRAVAIDFYRKAAAAEPNDLTSRGVLVDLGSAAGDRAVVDQALAEIARIEGPDGPLGTLGRIAVELPTAGTNPEKIRELRARAEKVRAERQGWSRVYVALAKLDQMALQTDSALANYRLAIRTGDRSEEVIRRTFDLLRERKKDVEAAHLLNDVYTQVPLPDDLERFRAVMNLLGRDVPNMERAVIDKIAPPREKDTVRKDEHKLQLLRGTLLASIRADVDAEAAYRDALALEDNIPETWTALIAHLGRVGKKDEAKHVLTRAEEKLKTRPPADPVARAKLIVALADGYETVGDLKAAEERYAEAVKVAPKDLGINRKLVEFLQRNRKAKEADAVLIALSADPAPELHRWARRYRAITLVSRADAYEQRKTALDLIAQNLATGPADSEDQKARAIVLTLDPETRKEGMETLRGYAERSELVPDEYALLGRLYFDRGDLDMAVAYFRQASQPGPGQTPEHLALLVRAELARNQLVRAERAADRLRLLAPGSWEAARETAVVLARKARVTSDKEDAAKLTAQAKELVLKFPATAANPVFAVAAAAPLLDEIGAPADAEALYRKALEADAGSHLPLAVFLIQHHRAAEAVDLAFKYEAKAPVVVTARVLSGAARDLGPADAAKAAEVERWLDAKLSEYRDKPEYGLLVGARAELLDAGGKYDEAIAEYRRAIALTADGRTSIAVNNLCMLIALREPGRAGEAIDLMNHLIGVRGPGPSFLDTRAVCYLVAGGTYRDVAKNKTGPELALADLELALVQKQGAVYRFHKAWAYHLLGKQAERDIALGEAKAGKLTPAQLHPLERDKVRELYIGFPGGPPG